MYKIIFAVVLGITWTHGAVAQDQSSVRWKGWCEYRALAGEKFPPARLNLPEWACNAAFEAKLHKQYDIYSRINPFFINADFNGDGLLDIAIWVTEKKSKKLGIVVLHNGNKLPFVMGAGKVWEERGDDFKYLDMWSTIPKGEVFDSGYEANRRVQLQGDALILTKSDSASFAIYWDGTKYVSYQLSD